MKRQIQCTIALLIALGCARGAPPPPEKPVIAAGLKPQEVYGMLHLAKQRLELDTVFACTSRRVMPTKNGLYEKLMQERWQLQDNIVFVGVETQKTAAVAGFLGDRRDRETGKLVRSRGKVFFVKEDGVWRFFREKWEVMKEEDMAPGDYPNLPPLAREKAKPRSGK